MSIVYLKVKIRSLAAEAAIIRHEERKYLDRRPGSAWFGLNYHRRYTVRREARVAALAYGYLRGRAYGQIENKCHDGPDWSRVTALVKRYGPPSAHAGLEAWKTRPAVALTENDATPCNVC